MVALARKTLIYEWRRFLPAALAVSFSGMLMLCQAALLFGIFASASVYISHSGAELWAGFPGTQTIELGRPIPASVELKLLLDPEVQQVDPFAWIEGDWRGPISRGGVSVSVSGININANGLAFSQSVSPEQRARLALPGSVLVDQADLPKLGIQVGEFAEINGHRVQLIGVAQGLRALGGVNVVASLATVRKLNSSDDEGIAYFIAKLKHPELANAVRDRINAERDPRFELWTREQFAERGIYFWLFDTGAGLGFAFAVLVVVFVGAVITSQTMMAAIAGSMREYATLRALGVSVGALWRVVLAQSAWIGCGGLCLGALLSALVLALAHSQAVPVYLSISTAAICAVLVLLIALGSGVVALGAVRRIDPATLLR